MKRYVLFLGTAAAFALAGCQMLCPVWGSGNPVTTRFDLGTFSRIEASQACRIHVLPGSTASLEVVCDDNLLEYLVVERTSTDTVSVGLKPNAWYLGITFTAEVRMPSVTALDLSGASEADVDPGFSSTQPLSLKLSGASRTRLDSLACGALTADLSGASILTLSGTADSEYVVISGASEAHLFECAAGSASANLSGASRCWLDVGSGSLEVTASGASTLYYRGPAALGRVDLSGTSRLVRMD
jgi:hypothetical protein